jgi:glycosyltransferase involved in cell wall biosynthesis
MSKSLHIAIDGNEANIAQRVGSNAYAFKMLVHLEEILRDREDIQVTILLSGKPIDDLPKGRENWQYKTFGPAGFWTQLALPRHLFQKRKEYSVFYTPGHYGPRVSPVPYVSSVMDLAFLYFPEQFKKKDYLQLREWTRYSVKHAKKVIAISEYTKKDVMKQYHLKASQVVVAYPSVVDETELNHKEKEKISTFKKWKIRQPFILYVGTLQPRKNIIRLVEAFEKLHAESEDDHHHKKQRTLNQLKAHELQLVIAGKTGWLADGILKRIKQSPVKEKIIVTGYVTDQEKTILYKESLCTVLVGLYEGFGIPALEALRHGSIPIVSSTTSLPEVVGEAGILVDPLSVKDIARGLDEVLTLPAKERAKLLKKGRQRLKIFRWSTSASIILETLLKVAKNE